MSTYINMLFIPFFQGEVLYYPDVGDGGLVVADPAWLCQIITDLQALDQVNFFDAFIEE